ncbi:hypothetical protein [Endozoicomonas sp. ONNA1]|uniref:hypothetical protein n=1 Tax=Endozoicomonas sp. ONNA1 TaxID=2828740 RepID=UPI002148805A|nr:hypothetical protein [Endozoicomonas sp. ONNA1]
MRKRHMSTVGFIVFVAALLVLSGFTRAGSLEWGGQEEGVCLQEGSKERDQWSQNIKKKFNWLPHFSGGRLAYSRSCDQDKMQDWEVDEDEVVSGEGRRLNVFRWRKQFHPLTSERKFGVLYPVRYLQQRLSFQFRDSRYCLVLNKNKRFESLSWEQCLQSVDTRWLFDLPTDPGEDGLIGLAGIDSNQDGVRDDVERFIERALGGSEKERKAALSFANSLQKELISAYDQNTVIALEPETGAALDCMSFVLEDKATKFLLELEAKTYNTSERLRAWNKLNSYFSGMTFTLTDDLESQCNFKREQQN